jgi:hypothetical protein
VVAGTAGGLVSPDDPVTVELYHRNSLVKKIDAKLDSGGKVFVGGLPVMPPVEALISIKHGGILQQVLSPELNSDQPNQALQMKVFETTDERPDWSIAMQHLILQWKEDGSGAQVTEMISASTPGDRAWLGAKGADQRLTMSIPLPPEADDVELGGSFDEDLTKIVDGRLVTGSALFPGRSEFRITYTVPAKNGALELPIVAPEAVGNLIVFLPADDAKVTAAGLSGGSAVDMGQGSVRMYRAENLKAGQTALLSIAGIKATTPADVPGAAGASAIKPPAMSARNVAMGGAFLIALIGAGMILIRKPQAKKE